MPVFLTFEDLCVSAYSAPDHAHLCMLTWVGGCGREAVQTKLAETHQVVTKWDFSPFDDDSWLIPRGLGLPTLALRLVIVREKSRYMKESVTFYLVKVAALAPSDVFLMTVNCTVVLGHWRDPSLFCKSRTLQYLLRLGSQDALLSSSPGHASLL